ncbi:MAG: hypothetical protein JSV04_14610 [Candidatus Heimdallarchaeota archaeon]|nr:MAG: hypothetical protein JSV04_14610 [Candidatus Heimdallarchaeota archaeon]
MKSIALTAIFFFLNIITPHMGWAGGFLTASEVNDYQTVTKYDFFWDRVRVSRLGASVTQSYETWISDLAVDLKAEFLWKFIPFWGNFFLILGICAAILVVIPPVLYLTNNNQRNLPFVKIGATFGLIGTVIEYLSFLLLLYFEDPNAFLTLETPAEPLDVGVNIFLFGFFIIGWVSLIGGSMMANKEYPSPMEEPIREIEVLEERTLRGLLQSDNFTQRLPAIFGTLLTLLAIALYLTSRVYRDKLPFYIRSGNFGVVQFYQELSDTFLLQSLTVLFIALILFTVAYINHRKR